MPSKTPKQADCYNKTSISEEKSTMSITLDLPPKIEGLLRQRAESTGQDISQIAIAQALRRNRSSDFGAEFG